MGYFLTTAAETAPSARSLASPKTHTPGSPVEERGFKPDRDLFASYPPDILVAGSFGDADSNLFESQYFLRQLKQSRVQVRFFQGGHAWCPQGIFDSLMDWMEESLFVDSPKPARSMGPGASTAAKSAGANTGKKREPPGADAFLWYLRKCRLQMESARGDAARCLMLERMLTVVTNGKLDQSKEMAVETQAWRAELAKLKASPEVTGIGRTALKAFADAQVAEAAFLNLMKHGKAEYGKMKFSTSERQALRKAISAYRAVERAYPDSTFAAPAKDAAASLEIALSKAE